MGVIHLVRTQKFPKKKHFLPSDTHTYVRVGIRGQEMLIFRKTFAYILNEWSYASKIFQFFKFLNFFVCYIVSLLIEIFQFLVFHIPPGKLIQFLQSEVSLTPRILSFRGSKRLILAFYAHDMTLCFSRSFVTFKKDLRAKFSLLQLLSQWPVGRINTKLR